MTSAVNMSGNGGILNGVTIPPPSLAPLPPPLNTLLYFPPPTNPDGTQQGSSAVSLKQLNTAVIAVLLLLVVVIVTLIFAKARHIWQVTNSHRNGGDGVVDVNGAAGGRARTASHLQPVGQRGFFVDERSVLTARGMTPEEIACLGKTFEFKGAGKEGKEGGCEAEAGARECTVCLGEYQEKDVLRQLCACTHIFHQDCIDAWLLTHVSCPLCRKDLHSLSPKKEAHSSEPNSDERRPIGECLTQSGDVVVNINVGATAENGPILKGVWDGEASSSASLNSARPIPPSVSQLSLLGKF